MTNDMTPQIAIIALVVIGAILLLLDDGNFHFAVGYASGSMVVLFTTLWIHSRRYK